MNDQPQKTLTPPVVMVFSGLDPTGGAGLQADIEAIASMGCHAAPIASCLTVQTTSNVQAVYPVDGTLILEQARAVLEDMPVHAFKLGLMASVAAVETIATILSDYPDIPVVLDPVVSAGGGGSMTNDATVEALMELVVPLATVMTPNSVEARKLVPGGDSLDACAMGLISRGCDYALITGTHRRTEQVINTLYGNQGEIQAFNWTRLTDVYHGSGCTLASALAGLVAQGQDLLSAVYAAQRYTAHALKSGSHLGMGQLIPNRLFWIDETKS